MDSFEKIIHFAIRHEEAEARFYENLANRATSSDLKAHLLERSREEGEHKRQLEMILADHHLPDGGKRYHDPDLHLADYMVTESMDVENINYQDALIMATKRERAAQRLYTDLATQASEPGLREVFTFLAEQEGDHRAALEREYEDNILKEG